MPGGEHVERVEASPCKRFCARSREVLRRCDLIFFNLFFPVLEDGNIRGLQFFFIKIA